MNFFQAIASGFSNYINFSDRASRSEYWYWLLFVFLGGLITQVIDIVLFQSEVGLVNALFSLATLVPGLSVGARRLHDIDRTGWWQLLSLTVIGVLVLIYWFVQPGNEGPNRFGEPVSRSKASDDASVTPDSLPPEA